jgi:hypothetical protein
MTEQNLYERVKEPDDPRRCQGMIGGKGQCWLVQVDGSRFCIVHGGSIELKQTKEKELKNYRLAKYKQRVGEFADSDQIKSLRDEIGILRILIEERLNYVKDTHDLLMHSTVISDLVMKVEKLVTSCNRLETNLGVMMDKTQLLQFCSEAIDVIGRHVEDQETLSLIADDLIKAIDRPKAG